MLKNANWTLFHDWSGVDSEAYYARYTPDLLAAFQEAQTQSNHRIAQESASDLALIHRFYADKSITHVVQIGIGGSSLGTQMLYTALRRLIPQDRQKRVAFISNLDTDDADLILANLPVSQTVFIIVSKSGTTEETQQNLAIVQAYNIQPDRLIYITSKKSALDKSGSQVCYLDESIGGRYAITSGVSSVLIGIALHPDLMTAVRAGATDMHAYACYKPDQNMALTLALITACHAQVYPTSLIIPYSQALCYFPDYAQQLLCESNGKAYTHAGTTVSEKTSPLVVGGIGTNVQHAVFQLLHDGTVITPVLFIMSQYSQLRHHAQPAVRAHIMAQLSLFRAKNKPVLALRCTRLTATTIGNLIALYENLAVFQGLLWGLNPFDQPGVEAGKQLARNIVANQVPPEFQAYTQYLEAIL